MIAGQADDLAFEGRRSVSVEESWACRPPGDRRAARLCGVDRGHPSRRAAGNGRALRDSGGTSG